MKYETLLLIIIVLFILMCIWALLYTLIKNPRKTLARYGIDIDQVTLHDVKTLIDNNESIPAIRTYRMLSGLGLKDSREAIENYRNGNDLVIPKKKTKEDLTAAQIHEIRELLMRNQKIAAISLYRKYTGAGLRDAKDEVEKLG